MDYFDIADKIILVRLTKQQCLALNAAFKKALRTEPEFEVLL